MALPSDGNAPALSLPKGGGAVSGIGETFKPDSFTGSGSYALPLAVSPGRGSFTPDLRLTYSTGAGNGIFGLGWSLSLPAITRRTDRGLPRYDHRDRFVLSNTEEVVPQLEDRGGVWESVSFVRDGFAVTRYRPRTEGLFARIERWAAGADVHWRVVDTNNVTEVFGRSANARISDPADASRIFQWLLEESYDARGNHILYEYARDAASAAADGIEERNRAYAQRYLRRVFYGNFTQPLTYASGGQVGVLRTRPDPADSTQAVDRRYALELLFDYGDLPVASGQHVQPDPYVAPGAGPEILAAPARVDRFSTYRPGFELRTRHRCHRLLMVHHFQELGGPTVVQSTNFDYGSSHGGAISLLRAVSRSGYRRAAAGYVTAGAPPVDLEYTPFVPSQQRYQSLQAPGGALPAHALTNRDYAFIDMFGDALPDIVQADGRGMRYWRNRGGGRFDRPHTMHEAPVGVALSDPGVAVADLAGNGLADLVVHGPFVKGFYELAPDGGWQTLRHYHDFPNVALSDPNARLLDLTGDGRADLLVTAGSHFLWYEGRGADGFVPGSHVERQHDFEAFPDVFFGDTSGRVRLADMNGDGLDDVVLVHDGRVDYWPNLGYGRFGRRITMAAAPRFDAPFDPRRLFLVDLDGSGCADLIYVTAGRVDVWLNQSGNGWSGVHAIHGTPAVTNRDAIQFADVFGTGTATLVWSYDFAFQPGGNYKALDFCGGRKPHLLTTIRNNVGAETRVHYAPSTAHFLRDRDDGRDWATTLPFPVHVVDAVETTDAVSGTRRVTRYRYHHGYFDGHEREFRGFAFVEQFDSDPFEPGGAIERADHAATTLTRSWFHTGVFAGTIPLSAVQRTEFWNGDTAEPPLADHDVPADRDAYRALRGALVRQEVFALDDDPRAGVPVSVTEQRHGVRQMQPAQGLAGAVYLPMPRETLACHYERDAGDPRVGHDLTLRVDDFGNVTDRVMVAYPRRQPSPSLPEQAERAVRYVRTDYINQAAAPTLYYAGIACETRTFEILGASPSGAHGRFVAGDFDAAIADLAAPLTHGTFLPFEAPATGAAAEKRLLDWTRVYFRADAGANDVDPQNTRQHRLPLGQIDALGFPFETLEAVWTTAFANAIYGTDGAGSPRVTPALLTRAGYVEEADVPGYWWRPSARAAFDPQQCYRLRLRRDAFGHVSSFAYDAYCLLPTATTDPTGAVTRATHDYRVMQPDQLTDANGNLAMARYDTVGRLVGTATASASGEGDSFADFDADLDPADRAAFFQDPVAHAARLLGTASTRIVYDAFAYMHGPAAEVSPVYSASLAREAHASSGAAAGVHIKVGYSDGMGREVQARVQAESTAGTRWAASGWTLFNNKGQPVQQFDPFFSATHRFEGHVRNIVPTRLFYDALGRTICTLHPNHSYEKTVFRPWSHESWDANDTVLQADPRQDPDVGRIFAVLPVASWSPTWYAQRSGGGLGPDEQTAALGAAAHAATPQVTHLDGLQRPIARVVDAGAGVALTTRVHHDAAGNVRLIVDPRGVHSTAHTVDMLRRPMRVVSAEAGDVRTLRDVAGDPLWVLDAAGAETVHTFDELHRPTAIWVRPPGQPLFDLVRHTAYGRGATPPAANLRGQVWKVYDGAGLLITEAYDFKKNALRATRTLVRDAMSPPVWGRAADPWGHQFDEAAAQALLDASLAYTSESTFDALNRLVSTTTPDGSTQTTAYNLAGLLESIAVRHPGGASHTIVDVVEYDARGERTRITYGNGVATDYEYDPATRRLTLLRTRRRHDGARPSLQDLTYTYDPVGNLVAVRDDCHRRLFRNNQPVAAASTFAYDAAYRLIRATGREHQSMTACRYQDGAAPQAAWVAWPQPASNSQAVQNYEQRYQYDNSGNLTGIRHLVNGATVWVRHQTFGAAGNRLHTSDAGCTNEAAPIAHDAHGNLVALPHLPRLEWNDRQQLVGADLNAGATPDRARYQYDAAGARVRKRIVRQNGAHVEERVYLGGYETYTRSDATGLQERWQLLTISDGQRRVAVIETKRDPGPGAAVQSRLVRLQLVNHLGSSCLEVEHDDTARLISYEEYYPFGETAYVAGQHLVEVKRKRYRFTGKEREDETGLYYFGLRYLAPWMGRWITCDPAGVVDGLNPYVYVRNNPLALIDPSGATASKLHQVDTVQEGLEVLEKPPRGGEHVLARNTATGELWIWQGWMTSDMPEGWELISHSHTRSITQMPSEDDYVELARRGQRTHYFYSPEQGWRILEFDAGKNQFTQTIFRPNGEVVQVEMKYDAAGKQSGGETVHWLEGKQRVVGTHQGITPEHMAKVDAALSQQYASTMRVRTAVEALNTSQLNTASNVHRAVGGAFRVLVFYGVVKSAESVGEAYLRDLDRGGLMTYEETSKQVASELSGWACASVAAGPSSKAGGALGGAAVGAFTLNPLGIALGAIIGAGLVGLGGSMAAYMSCNAAAGVVVEQSRAYVNEELQKQ